MNVEKAAIKYLFESKSLEFFSALKQDYFQRPMAKTVFKALRSYIGTYHKIPDVKVFTSALMAKLPEDKQEIYSSFLEGVMEEEVEATPEELLDLLKEHYIVSVLDNNIEALVLASKDKNVEAIKKLVNKIEADITVTEKLPEDIRSLEYTPSKIKLIDPFMPTMKKHGLRFGGLTLIAGGSGGGKSIFLLQQLMFSYENGADVCLLNLELGLDETIARMYSIATGEEFASIYGNTDPKVVEKVDKWRREYFDRDNQFYIKNSSFDTQEIETIIRAMEKKGVHIFGVDYLNLVELSTDEDWKGLSRMVKALHRLSQELSLVILTPTQVNITDTKEKDGELKVTTRGSRELEFSATVFLFIYQTKEEYATNTARIFTIKARNAQKKTYIVETDFKHMRFIDTGMVL
jgi:archaellum biogenesis ATPase FlaH